MSHPRNRRERFVIGDTKGKRRAYGYWGGYYYLEPEKRKELLDRASQRRRNTTKLCSCPMCGNQRRFFGPTFQEVKYRDSSLTDFDYGP